MARINEQIAADIIFHNKYHGESRYLIICSEVFRMHAFVDHPAGMYTHLQSELEKFK